jgi:hypothetical protein
MKRAIPVGIFGWVLWLSGCGGSMASHGEASETETETATESEAGGMEGGDSMIVMSGADLSAEDQETVGEFDQMTASYDAQMQNDPSGCSVACEMKDRVCDLSERICEIAERHPRDGRLGGRCGDGRDRCARAGEAVRRCGCEGD